jgi:hypothetical protein
MGICGPAPDLGGSVSGARFESGLGSANVTRAQWSLVSDACFGTAALKLCADPTQKEPSLFVGISATDAVGGMRYRGIAWVKVSDPTRVSAIIKLSSGGNVITQSSPSLMTTDWQVLSTTGSAQPMQTMVAYVTIATPDALRATDCVEVDQLALGPG